MEIRRQQLLEEIARIKTLDLSDKEKYTRIISLARELGELLLEGNR